MARIQVLHLPAPPDEYPFALIVDQMAEGDFPDLAELKELADYVGARGLLVSTGTVEVL